MTQNQKILTLLIVLVHFSSGMYIRGAEEQQNQNVPQVDSKNVRDEWNTIKRKLQLSDEKVEFLKSQKDQDATMDLVNQFIKQNPKYITIPSKPETPNHFLKIYHSLVNQLKLSRSTLKTSLKFELADKPQKNLKRTRRKIAVKMISDLPSEKIDELLEMFNEQHGINNSDMDSDTDADIHDNNDAYYTDFAFRMSPPSDTNTDYTYDQLYDDEAVPTKSNHNSQFGSFQDLILQSQRNLLQREMEETKLRTLNNEHFLTSSTDT